MPADASIYGQLRQPEAPNPLAQLAQFMQVKGLQDQSALAQYTIGKAKRGDEETNALADAIRGGLDLSTPEGSAKAFGIAPTIAPTYIKTNLESQHLRSQITESGAKAKKEGAEAAAKAVEQHRQALAGVTDAQGATQWLHAAYANPDLTTITSGVPFEQAASRIPKDPQQFKDWLNQQALGMTKYVELNKPGVHVQDTGGTSNIVAVPGLGGAPAVLSSTQKTATPGEVLSANTSRANNRDTIAKDFKVAGLDAQGNFPSFAGPGGAAPVPGATGAAAPAGGAAAAPAGPLQGIIQSIGTYKAPESVAFARVPPAMRSQILAEVQRQYPDYDPSMYHARRAATVSFSTGKDGQAVQSANTALNHLGTLRELATAQDNGDIRLFNTIANRIKTETGGEAPTNLAAAITMVGPEISKAVVGSGGTGGDRDKVDAALAALTKGGKGQAAGTLATMEDLFGGRLTEAKRTYERTTGRKDFSDVLLSPAAQRVLAARAGAGGGSPGAAAPLPGIDRDAIAAELRRRGVK